MNKNRNTAQEPFYSLGADFIALGEAFQDKRTTIEELAMLAHKCGLRVRFSIGHPVEQKEEGRSNG